MTNSRQVSGMLSIADFTRLISCEPIALRRSGARPPHDGGAGGCTELNPTCPLSDAGEGNVASKRSRHRLRAAPAERSASRLCSCCAPSHRSSHFRQRSRGVHMSQFRKLLRRMSRSRGMSQFRTAAQQARRCHCHEARRRRRQRCACGSAAVDDRRARRPPRDRHAPPPRSTC